MEMLHDKKGRIDMFRAMRRSKQELSREETISILKDGITGILSVQGDDGYPYTVPVNYIYVEPHDEDGLGSIIFHGAKAGHKYDAMKRCDKVSFCVIADDTVVPEKLTAYFRSVIAFGRVRILETPEDIKAAAYALGMKYWPNEEGVTKEIDREMRALACFEIDIEHLSGKEAIELTRARKQAE